MSEFRKPIENLLAKLELELQNEFAANAQMLKECKLNNAVPAKDYWHKQHDLGRKVIILRELLLDPEI